MKRSRFFLKRIQHHSSPAACLGMGFLFFCLVFHDQQVTAQELIDEQVETLEAIEVPATVVVREERQIVIPEPDLQNLRPLPAPENLVQAQNIRKPYPTANRTEVAQDGIAKTRGVHTRVKPAKAERPPYPRFAREQGWEGTVVLRVRVNRTGSVDAVQTRQTSGYSILDDSAIQSVKNWTFEPAKDGEFPIPVTVDLPIRFDLNE